MNFFTSVDIPADLPRLTHRDHLLLMGSCFATNMGVRLADAKFPCLLNPYGVLYNPLSISTAIREALDGKVYAEADLYEHEGLWHSPMHHGDFSASTAEETLECINGRLGEMRAWLSELDCLMLTWGSAWVYEDRQIGRIVGNCHKLPERCFNRRRLSVDEIVEDYVDLIGVLRGIRPKLKILFTVSPIRHIRDGLHDNQLSKATLLLTIDALKARFPQSVFYFPAYEIVLDELRDYRFYASDMVHPSEVAVDYVWERFCASCLTEESMRVMDECEKIRKALEHKPFRPESEGYKSFLEQIVLKINRLKEKYPYLDFEKEIKLCHIRLNK